MRAGQFSVKFKSGLEPDSQKRWAVSKVLEARRSKTGGIWGKLRWCGVQQDGTPRHPDSWVRLLCMSAVLREEARSLLPAPRVRIRKEKRPKRVGERRSARVAAQVAAAAASSADAA